MHLVAGALFRLFRILNGFVIARNGAQRSEVAISRPIVLHYPRISPLTLPFNSKEIAALFHRGCTRNDSNL